MQAQAATQNLLDMNYIHCTPQIHITLFQIHAEALPLGKCV